LKNDDILFIIMFIRAIRLFTTKLPPTFDPKLSKYSGIRETKNLRKKVEMADAPEYLRDEQKFVETTSTSYELENPVK